MLYWAFPHHTARTFALDFVLDQLTLLGYAADAYQDAVSALDEWNVLGVEEAKGILFLDVVSESLEKRFLVSHFVHPVRFVADVRLAVGIYVQFKGVAKLRHVAAHHPSERHHGR
ncbi:MAG: hypothetical protein ACJ796_14315 [Gemmatimonadaceae bacterium]